MEDHIEDVANYERDATIYLVPYSTKEKQDSTASPTRKRKRIAKNKKRPEAAVLHGLVPLCEIHANSTRLRQCSKYFESLMSGRWTVQTEKDQSSSAMKFFLEVQTEERYYQDCFSRMYLLHQPIESVKQCIELLKVASQIEYKELMDICLQCLSAIPWTSGEEEQIREFCVSGQYLSSDSSTDLSARLQLPLTKRDKQKELGACLQRTLRRYLSHCTPEPVVTYCTMKFCKRVESRGIFKETFNAIVSGSVSGNMGHSVLQYALSLVKEELERLWSSVKWCSLCVTSDRFLKIEEYLTNFRWLFRVLRKANAAQGVVEVIVKDGEVSQLLLAASTCHESAGGTYYGAGWPNWHRVHMTLTDMITEIFEDVLHGHLFLKASDRMTLFQQWNWILQENPHLSDEFEPTSSGDEPTTSCAKVLASLITSFPLVEQEEINRLWMGRTDHDVDIICEKVTDFCDLKKAHRMWIMNLVTQMSPPREQKHTASHENQCNPADKDRVSTAADEEARFESFSATDPEAPGPSRRVRAGCIWDWS